MISSPQSLMALALGIVMLAVASLPMSSARPVACKNGSDCLQPWNEADYNEYVARYNPFNGTAAAILYTPKEAKAMLEILASSTASRADPVSRQSLLQCLVGAAQQWLSYSCMYDTTAKITTANCGMRCSSMRYTNGQYYGYVKDESSNLPSKADRCCFNHDIALHNRGNPISATSRAACPIHRAMYNCMVSKNTAWGIGIAKMLVSCMNC